MRKVAILVSDGGDGSQGLDFFNNVLLAEKVASDDKYCEVYGGNEGSPTIIEVQEDFEPPFSWSDDYFYKEYGVSFTIMPECPHCGSPHTHISARNQYSCDSCGHRWDLWLGTLDEE